VLFEKLADAPGGAGGNGVQIQIEKRLLACSFWKRFCDPGRGRGRVARWNNRENVVGLLNELKI
jgi:hypothetical protein